MGVQRATKYVIEIPKTLQLTSLDQLELLYILYEILIHQDSVATFTLGYECHFHHG